jgi:hypothetical protein
MKTFLMLIVAGVLLFAGAEAIRINNKVSGEARGEPKYAALKQAKLDVSWNKGGFGSVMIADFKVQNPTPYRLKDLDIKCTNFGKSGTELDTNEKTVYDIIEPNSARLLKHVNMGFIHSQAASTSCEIVDLVIVTGATPTTR